MVEELLELLVVLVGGHLLRLLLELLLVVDGGCRGGGGRDGADGAGGERRGGGGGGRGGVGERDAHPRVVEDVLELDAVGGADAQAAADEVLALVGEAGAELDLGHADLLVLLEGDVAADHVVEEDAEAPDRGRVAVVAGAADPLRGSINPRTCKS